jgi:predicted nucleotidyltransferase
MNQEESEIIIKILRQNQIAFAALFGSRAKGNANAQSDYDLLIDTHPQAKFSLFDHVGLKDDLESALKVKFDLVTIGGLNPHMKDSVTKTMKVLYDERER